MTTTKENSSLKINTKLDETNYALWHFQIEILLEQENCFLVDDDGEPSYCITTNGTNQLRKIKECAKSRLCIVNNCAESMVTTLMNMRTADQMWIHLYQAYSGENYSRKLQGIKAIAAICYNGGTIADYIDQTMRLLNTTIIAAGKDQISLTELALALTLNGLPNRFATIRSNLENDAKHLTISNVRMKIIEEDQRQKLRGASNSGFAAKVTGTLCSHKRIVERCWTCTPNSHPSNFTCTDCGTKGHKSSRSPSCSKHDMNKKALGVQQSRSDDWNLPKPDFGSRTLVARKRTDLRQVLDSRKRPKTVKDHYVMDSGCSQTILMNKDKMSNYLPYYSTMSTADDGVLTCIGRRDSLE